MVELILNTVGLIPYSRELKGSTQWKILIMDNKELKNIYNNLIQSLKLVASPADIQMESLPDFVNVADEIALTYNESYRMVPQLKSIIPPHIRMMLDDLDNLFEEMSKDKSLWNIDELKTHTLWMKSRELALLILNDLKEKYTSPNLDFIKWVK